MDRTCIVCGKQLIGRHKRFCSPRCIKKEWKSRHRKETNDWQRAWFRKKAREDWVEKTCVVCAKTFLPSIRHKGQQICCSTKCMRRRQNKRCKAREKAILVDPSLDPERHALIVARKKVQDANYKMKTRKCGDACGKDHLHLRDWLEVRESHKNLCAICGKPETPEDPLGIDHILPVSKGGHNNKENVQPAHFSCNASKGNRWW